MFAAGRGERVALIWDSPVTSQIVRFTYRELRDAVARLAGVLAGLGVVKATGVLIYMRWSPRSGQRSAAPARASSDARSPALLRKRAGTECDLREPAHASDR